MRFKRRYFCVEIIFQDDISLLSSSSNKVNMHKLKHNHLSEAVHQSIEKFYGDFGMAVMMPSFSVIYFNMNTNLAILRTARDTQKKFHNLLTFTKKLDQYDVAFRVIHVSGSIKKCKKFLVGHCQSKLNELKAVIKISQNQNEQMSDTVNVYERLLKASELNDNTLSLN